MKSIYKEPIIFQIIGCSIADKKNGFNSLDLFKIKLYGRTKDNKTIFVEVNDFCPYFYVEIPKNWRKIEINIFIRVGAHVRQPGVRPVYMSGPTYTSESPGLPHLRAMYVVHQPRRSDGVSVQIPECPSLSLPKVNTAPSWCA